MQDLKLVLSKYIVRRRLDGGEFTYVFRPENLSVPGKKQILAVLKQDEKLFSKLKEESEVMETDDSDFDSQILKVIPMLPYEDAVKTEAATIEKEPAANEDEKGEDDLDLKILGGTVPPHEFTRTVMVNFHQKGVSLEVGENFLRKVAPQIMLRSHRSKKKVNHFRLTFNTEKESYEFCEKELEYDGKPLVIRHFVRGNIKHKLLSSLISDLEFSRLKIAFWLKEQEQDLGKYIFAVIGLKENTEEVRASFKTAKSFKAIHWLELRHTQHQNYFRGYLLEYEDKESADKFYDDHLKDLETSNQPIYIQKVDDFMNCITDLTEVNNLGEDSEEADRKLVMIEHRTLQAVRNMFPSCKSISRTKNGVGRVRCAQFIIVEFETAANALEANGSTEGLNSMAHVPMKEFFTMRSELMKRDAGRIAKTKAPFLKGIEDKAAAYSIEVKDDKIEVFEVGYDRESEIKNKNKTAQTDGHGAKNSKNASTETQKKQNMRTFGTQTSNSNKKLAQRMNQVGLSQWDPFIVVTGIKPKNPNLGTPSQMDVCDYFIHNHKNVLDVKFLHMDERSGHSVIVKFGSKESADRFLELDYVLFFGMELNRNLVNNYLKGKSQYQKDDVSRMLLGRKYQEENLQVGTKRPATVVLSKKAKKRQKKNNANGNSKQN